MEERDPTREAEARLARFGERYLPKPAGIAAVPRMPWEGSASMPKAESPAEDRAAIAPTPPPGWNVRSGDFVFLKPVMATGNGDGEDYIGVNTGLSEILLPMSMVDRIEPGRPGVGERCRIEGDSFLRTVIAIVDELAWVRSKDGDSIVFLNKLARA